MYELINEDEVKCIRDSAVILNLHNVIFGDTIPVPKFIVLLSGYGVGMSVDEYPTGEKVEHLSVSNYRGMTDPADAEIIARAVFGSGYKVLGVIFSENTLHFMKPLDKKAELIVDRIMCNIEEFRRR